MNTELTIRESDMTVDSVTVAEYCGVQHRAALQLLNTHKSKLETKFGPIAFEMRKGQPLKHGGFAKKTRLAHLTEDQATAFITLFQNTERVVDFKFALVAAFSKAKRHLAMTEPTPEQIARFVESRYLQLTQPACGYGALTKDGRRRTGWRRPTFTASPGRMSAAREVAAALLVMEQYLPGFQLLLEPASEKHSP